MLPRTEVQGSERKPTEGRLLLLARKFISGKVTSRTWQWAETSRWKRDLP